MKINHLKELTSYDFNKSLSTKEAVAKDSNVVAKGSDGEYTPEFMAAAAADDRAVPLHRRAVHLSGDHDRGGAAARPRGVRGPGRGGVLDDPPLPGAGDAARPGRDPGSVVRLVRRHDRRMAGVPARPRPADEGVMAAGYCTVAGCWQPVFARGWCRKHYSRARRGRPLQSPQLRSYLRDGHMPPPDGKLGQSLWWWASTIDEWAANRPPVGRPRKR